jgi:hypothetical protein
MIHLGRMLMQDSLVSIKEKYPDSTLEDIFLDSVGNDLEEVV